ncbi:MAG: hypothetical protein Q7T55_06055 [Solirubrobacteraceae bacterium]|nr:hypothetical protein [Solirubrobacteraceae bacterium]
MRRPSLLISSQMPGAHADGIPSTVPGVRLITLGFFSALALGVAGCGSVSSAKEEPAAKPVQLDVTQAKFSKTVQTSGDSVVLSMTITNAGSNPAPNVIVSLGGLEETTLENPEDETRIRTEKDDLPDATKRAAWFIDEAPAGGQYGASTLYEGGALAPGRSRTLRWRLGAQQPGKHTLTYRVLSGLTDNEAKATTGQGISGEVSATIEANATK